MMFFEELQDICRGLLHTRLKILPLHLIPCGSMFEKMKPIFNIKGEYAHKECCVTACQRYGKKLKPDTCW